MVLSVYVLHIVDSVLNRVTGGVPGECRIRWSESARIKEHAMPQGLREKGLRPDFEVH